jgi:hypothetical protein
MQSARYRRFGVLAILSLTFAFAYVMQVNGYNQNAHYAFVRALADGKPWIDRSITEIGQVSTGDISRFDGHLYAAKAPGLALVSVPALLAVEATGMRTIGDPTRPIWALHLWGVVGAGVAILLLVWMLGDRLEPRLGVAAAVATGVGTLLLPFGTLYFSHVLAALLGFAAFALLWVEREGGRRLGLVAAAGASAGLAVTTEHPLVFVGAILGLYAISRGDVIRRGLAYAAGVLAGLAPLLLYNWWAFGSPTHFAYYDNLTAPEVDPGRGLFGFGLPSAHVADDLLFSSMGLLTITPVTACGVAGAVLLYRRGGRAEALAILGVAATYLAYNASLRYFSAFGGLGPPRYLVTVVPFLGVPLAIAFRSLPLTTIALGAVSALQMTVMTATGPLAAYDGGWLERLRAHDVSQTAASLVGVTGWYAIVPFFAACAAAVAFGVAAGWPLAVLRRELPLAVAALLAWALVALRAANPNGSPPGADYVLAVVALVGAIVVALAWATGTGPGLPRLPWTRSGSAAHAFRRAR